jgi:CheY-like chemotaxis protein
MSRILILDDSAFVRAFVKSTLGRAGYVVETAEDWITVRRILGANKPVHMVLLDVNLPGLQDGNNLALSLSRHPTTQHAKLVLFSGKTEAELKELSNAPELAGYIVKGKDPAELVTAVERFIGPPKPVD